MSATPPLPGLEVASATFFHRECSHEQLFHSEYKRSNRTKGLKILRCFPHCCPEHIDRSYCGTSLSVRVELDGTSPSSPPRDPPPSEIMALFARFEAVNDGQWVAGTLDRPSRLVTTIRKPGAPSDDHKPLVFHLNGKPFSRWYYDWESGANKAQRLTKHVLKAYIVERCAIDKDGNFTAFTGRQAHTHLYRVLRVTTSPEFTVISSAGFSPTLEDKLRWEYTNPSTVSVSRDIALLYAFLCWTPVSAYASYLHHLLRALVHASHWFYSAETRKWVNTFFRQYARSVLDKHAMRACFVLFVQKLQDRLDSQVFESTELRTLANAAEEVIAAVYSYSYFHARRPHVRQILSGQDFAGWNAFVAQMRETYIGLSTCHGIPHSMISSYTSLNFDRVHPPRNYIENAWNAEWLLEINEAEWKFTEQNLRGEEVLTESRNNDVKSVISLLNVFELMSQMVRLEMAIDVEKCSLHVRSTQGVANALDCMRVVLDGKERIFSQLPNGVASAINPGSHGNYIGEMRVERSDRLAAYLQIFIWSAPENGPSFNLRLRIECWRSRQLCISGDVLVTSTLDTFTPEQASSLGEMSLRDKREAVANTYANQHLHEATTNGNSAAANAWMELGRFRLNYTKV
ncbi:hypothetical protein PHMEG_00014897 [Phytophthora megakarya]|uniref:Uncharacterized protein n=1 Tax=Phytophthora megakarya TaxID=4795 RepID=A0A225W2T3_9STRA|nr:hypothetical protein PHMEG_00014897 [Phytophthora megakarya]